MNALIKFDGSGMKGREVWNFVRGFGGCRKGGPGCVYADNGLLASGRRVLTKNCLTSRSRGAEYTVRSDDEPLWNVGRNGCCRTMCAQSGGNACAQAAFQRTEVSAGNGFTHVGGAGREKRSVAEGLKSGV